MDEMMMKAREKALEQAVAITVRHMDRLPGIKPSDIVELAEAFEAFLTRPPARD